MLGRLIQTAASYGKSNASLESATEEAHTRNLLYGQSQHAYSLSQSPPASPLAGPAFRPGSFDDRGGLELEEKDLRLIIAQDAYGAEERPTVLLDSNIAASVAQTSPSHIRHASTTQAGTRAPLPSDWRPGAPMPQGNTQPDVSFRNRSSTMSSAPSAWTRQLRDTSTKEEALLECMFGVTSSTKATSTIKMHVIPAKLRPGSPGFTRGGVTNESAEAVARRMPVVRSRTSNMSPRTQLPTLSSLNTDSNQHDAVLITRLFHVSLPESIGTKDQNVAASPLDSTAAARDLETTPVESEPPKKPKLVERKVPAFAIGLILQLPRSPPTRTAPTRPGSRATQATSISTKSNSFGSDLQASWSFLNAIPESFAASRNPPADTDRRIDVIVDNWEIILRAITALEHEATKVIFEQLDRNLQQISGPSQKVPKEKAMQRINQRVISITNPTAIAERGSLMKACRHTIRRVCYALRVPRVATGLGFAAGHWADEARMLYRICGRRQQNFFLFTLLTAFLGNHTQWLQRLAPEWYQRQFRASRKAQSGKHVLAPRTIIISDQRTIARRLLFVLASFLPASSGLDGLQKVGEDFNFAGRFSTSSPSSQLTRIESLRRTANRKLRDNRLHFPSNDRSLLSTSASSTDSITPYLSKDRSLQQIARKDSDALSITGLHVSHIDTESRKTGAGATSAITPNPTTPVAYFSTKHDSYFPEGVLAETHESVASADLAKILRRSSSSGGASSNMSSRWGSLVSGFSDLWGHKQHQSGDISGHTPPSSSEHAVDRGGQQGRAQGLARARNTAPKYVDDANEIRNDAQRATDDGRTDPLQNSAVSQPQSPLKSLASPPRLKVDDKDGVIDVDLDWPGFSSFLADGSLFSPPRKCHRPSAASAGDGSDSIRSLRSIPRISPKAPVAEETSVAGFLRRHHQDFALHAVRPYLDLESDIKHSMMMEPAPRSDNLDSPTSVNREDWTEVCTTLIADVRTFSIRRLVLRRKLPLAVQTGSDEMARQSSEHPPKLVRRATFSNVEQEFVEEDVKDFDTTLADAVERVLNLAEALQPHHPRPPGSGHARTLSNNTSRSTSIGVSNSFSNDMLSITHEYAKQDCRQVIMGALEDIVKDVNNDLDRQQKGRAILEARENNNISSHKEVKQDNLLREGVKQWLCDVDAVRAGH